MRCTSAIISCGNAVRLILPGCLPVSFGTGEALDSLKWMICPLHGSVVFFLHSKQSKAGILLKNFFASMISTGQRERRAGSMKRIQCWNRFTISCRRNFPGVAVGFYLTISLLFLFATRAEIQTRSLL